MTRRLFSEEQVIKILKVHEASVPLAELSREHGVAEGTIYTRKAKYGGMDVSETGRLKELGSENKKLKKLVRPRMSVALPTRPNERRSLELVSDQLADGRHFRVLNIVDNSTRECVGQLVDTSISGARLARFLREQGRPLPRPVVLDNGPELYLLLG